MKKLKLIDNWKWVARKAWSMKLMAASAFCAVTDAVLPILQPDIPHGVFSSLSAISAAVGAFLRLVEQRRD